MAAPVWGTTGILATDLGAGWEAQGGSDSETATRVREPTSNGDDLVTKTYNSVRVGTDRYIYTGAEAAFIAALAACTIPAHPGKYMTSAAVILTGVAIDYGRCLTGKRPMVTFSYRKWFLAADSEVYIPALATLSTFPEGVPELLANSDSSNSKIQSGSYEIACSLDVDLDKDGDELAGATYGGATGHRWSNLDPNGPKMPGRITNVADFGLFVEVAPQVEGLLHVSEISWQDASPKPRSLFKPGQKILVKVIGVSREKEKISLSLKALKPNPWEEAGKKYKSGDAVQGKIDALYPFGAIVDLEGDLQGQVHVSEFGGAEEMKEKLSLGQKCDFVIEDVKPDEKRIISDS